MKIGEISQSAGVAGSFFSRIRQHEAKAEFTSHFIAALSEHKPRRPPIAAQAGLCWRQHMTAQGQRRYQPVASAKGTSLLLVERGMAGFEVGKRLITIVLTTAWLIPVWRYDDGWGGCLMLVKSL